MKLTTTIIVTLILAGAAWAQMTPQGMQQAQQQAQNAAQGTSTAPAKPSPMAAKPASVPASSAAAKPASTAPAKPAAPKAAKAAKRTAPKSAAKAAAAPEEKPAESVVEAAAKKMAGKRDPFISPIIAKLGPNCSTGKKCLVIDQIVLRGIVKSPNGMIAVVENAAQKAYFLREGDPVFSGYVVKISGDSVVFRENSTDKEGKAKTRDVVKTVNAPVV